MRNESIALACFLLSACTSTPKATKAAGDPAQAGGALERPGIFAPEGADALALWPEAWRGELTVLEVLANGSTVKQGDVVARLDLRGIDEEIRQTEIEATSAAVRHAGLIERNKIDADAARAARAKAEADAMRAARALEGWRTKELDFARRGDEISSQYTQHRIDDQVDELGQLEAMYKADELVDQTEEIVLKRSKRDLAISRTSQALQAEQQRYGVEYNRARETGLREEAADEARNSLARLIAAQEIDERARQDAAKRSQRALEVEEQKLERLRRDRAAMTIVAPRAGVLLHGSVKDFHPGRAPRAVLRGQSLPAKSDVFLVADPNVRAVALEIPESRMGSVAQGARVQVRSVAGGGEAGGTISIDPYPDTANTNADDSMHPARVLLERPMSDARYGMRAKVVIDASQAKPTPKAQE